MSAVPQAARASAWLRGLSAKTLGVFAVVGLVVAFSLSSTLVKRAETAGVLVAFWRLATVSLAWNVVLWSTGRRVTLRDVRDIGSATIVRCVLVPASIKLLGERNWYLPSWLTWVPKVHVEGHSKEPVGQAAGTA